MTYTFKTLILTAIAATSLAAQTTMASAMDRDPTENQTFQYNKSVTTPSITQGNTVRTFITADTHAKPRSNATFLLQK